MGIMTTLYKKYASSQRSMVDQESLSSKKSIPDISWAPFGQDEGGATGETGKNPKTRKFNREQENRNAYVASPRQGENTNTKIRKNMTKTIFGDIGHRR